MILSVTRYLVRSILLPVPFPFLFPGSDISRKVLTVLAYHPDYKNMHLSLKSQEYAPESPCDLKNHNSLPITCTDIIKCIWIFTPQMITQIIGLLFIGL